MVHFSSLQVPVREKTRVITHRIAYLIDEHGVKPENILAITFTNKAAEEMQERVNKEIGVPYGPRVKICTFHTFCHRVLRQYTKEIKSNSDKSGLDENSTIIDQENQNDRHVTEIKSNSDKLGLDEDFAIIDQENQNNLIIEIVQELNFSSSNYHPRRMLNIISNLKGNLQEPTKTSEFSENGIRITDED